MADPFADLMEDVDVSAIKPLSEAMKKAESQKGTEESSGLSHSASASHSPWPSARPSAEESVATSKSAPAPSAALRSERVADGRFETPAAISISLQKQQKSSSESESESSEEESDSDSDTDNGSDEDGASAMLTLNRSQTSETPDGGAVSRSSSVSSSTRAMDALAKRHTAESTEFKRQLAESRRQMAAFRLQKEEQIRALKVKFKSISDRQKKAFDQVQAKRRDALSKAKKYKGMAMTVGGLKKEVASMKEQLKCETQKRNSLEAEIKRLSKKKLDSDKAYTATIADLKASLERTEMTKESVATEMMQASIAIDNLLAVEEMKSKMRCHIDYSKKGVFNLTVCKVILPDFDGDIRSAFDIQWFRLHNSEAIAIENGTDAEYQLCADDVGAMVQVRVVSKVNPDCVEDAKVGPVLLSKKVQETVDMQMVRIVKSQVEFEVTPQVTDAPTAEVFVKHLTATRKTLVLHMNRAKVKIRGAKKKTICKESYQTGMRLRIFANDNLFSLRLDESSSPLLFAAKNEFDRDVMAILLRVYTTKLRVTSQPSLALLQHLMSANAVCNEEDTSGAMAVSMVFDSKRLLSKMLQPYQSRRGSSSTMSLSTGIAAAFGGGTTLSASGRMRPILRDLPELSISARSGVSAREFSATLSAFPTYEIDDLDLDEEKRGAVVVKDRIRRIARSPGQTPTSPRSPRDGMHVKSAFSVESAATGSGSITALSVTSPISPSPDLAQSRVAEEKGPPAKYPEANGSDEDNDTPTPSALTEESSGMKMAKPRTADGKSSIMDAKMGEEMMSADSGGSEAPAMWKGIAFVSEDEAKTATAEDLDKHKLGGGGLALGGKRKKPVKMKSSKKLAAEKKLKKRGKKGKKNTVSLSERMDVIMKEGKPIAVTICGTLSVSLTEAVTNVPFALTGLNEFVRVSYKSEAVDATEGVGNLKLSIAKAKSFVEVLQYSYDVKPGSSLREVCPLSLKVAQSVSGGICTLEGDTSFVKAIGSKKVFVPHFEVKGVCEPESASISECNEQKSPHLLKFDASNSKNILWMADPLADDAKKAGVKWKTECAVSEDLTGLKMTAVVDFSGFSAVPLKLAPKKELQLAGKPVLSLKHYKELNCRVSLI